MGFITFTPKTHGTDVRLVGDAHPTVCSLDQELEIFVMPDRDYTLIIDKSGTIRSLGECDHRLIANPLICFDFAQPNLIRMSLT